MLISSKELKVYLANLDAKINKFLLDNPALYNPDDKLSNVLMSRDLILTDIQNWEAKQLESFPELPNAVGSDQERALVIYCTPKLYEFVDRFDSSEEKDIGLLEFGKIWLEVKKFLKEGKFKRV